MNSIYSTRIVASILIVAAILLLLGDVLQLANAGIAWTVLLALAFTAFAAGLLLLPIAFATEPRGLMVAGSILAFLGSVAGASMQALFRAWEVLKQSSYLQALGTLQSHRGITFTTLVPGILFPAGLLLLSIALLRRGGIVLALPLALGAILFPIGHAVGLPAALIGGDVVLLVAFLLLATRQRPAAP